MFWRFLWRVTGYARGEISRKTLENIHVADDIQKRMLNRRTHLQKIDNARLPTIVPAGLEQEETLEETCLKIIP